MKAPALRNMERGQCLKGYQAMKQLTRFAAAALLALAFVAATIYGLHAYDAVYQAEAEKLEPYIEAARIADAGRSY